MVRVLILFGGPVDYLYGSRHRINSFDTVVQSTPDKFTPFGPSKLGEIPRSAKLTEVVNNQRIWTGRKQVE